MEKTSSIEGKIKTTKNSMLLIAGILLIVSAIVASLIVVSFASLTIEAVNRMAIAGYDGTLEGSVKDITLYHPWEGGIKDAICILEETESITKTDDEGNFIFKEVPYQGFGFSVYTLRVEKKGYQISRERVAVFAPKTIENLKKNPSLPYKEKVRLIPVSNGLLEEGTDALGRVRDGDTMITVNNMIATSRVLLGALAIGSVIAAVVGAVFIFLRKKFPIAIALSLAAAFLPILAFPLSLVPLGCGAGAAFLVYKTKNEFV